MWAFVACYRANLYLNLPLYVRVLLKPWKVLGMISKNSSSVFTVQETKNESISEMCI